MYTVTEKASEPKPSDERLNALPVSVQEKYTDITTNTEAPCGFSKVDDGKDEDLLQNCFIIAHLEDECVIDTQFLHF